MPDLETRLAEARESMHFRSEPNIWSQRRGFDLAANIAREVVAEKDAEIAYLKEEKQELRDVIDRCKTEIARLTAILEQTEAELSEAYNEIHKYARELYGEPEF